MGYSKRMRREKIVEYDVLYQKFFDQELSAPPVDAASADILKKQADALREQAELLDLAEDLIMVLDMDHRILFWNRGAEKKYGWSRGEFGARTSATLLRTSFPPEPEERRS
ncbi:PAS domain-containing protein [Syntrophus sp. (in: bacteria)]|uniref:PAS domain-containing protein n=1 Tax=Syntrophus sp. (in: bacteria) TaxID=48412 RepID=UPI00345E5295